MRTKGKIQLLFSKRSFASTNKIFWGDEDWAQYHTSRKF